MHRTENAAYNIHNHNNNKTLRLLFSDCFISFMKYVLSMILKAFIEIKSVQMQSHVIYPNVNLQFGVGFLRFFFFILFVYKINSIEIMPNSWQTITIYCSSNRKKWGRIPKHETFDLWLCTNTSIMRLVYKIWQYISK